MKSVLSKKLLIAMALAVGLAALLTTAIQLASEFRRDIAKLNGNLDKVSASYLESLQDALWQLDVAQIRSILTTISDALNISYIAVLSPDTGPIEVGTALDPRDRVRELVIARPQGAPGDKPLGRLVFSASLRPLYADLGERLVLLLLVNGSKTFLLGLFLVIVINRMVTSRINRFSEAIQHPGQAGQASVLPKDFQAPVLSEQDEIDKLVTSFNQLQNLLFVEQEKLKTANAELQLKVGQLEEAKLEAEAAAKAKSNFLANTSHELRTPLTAIIGFIDLIKSSDRSPQTLNKFLEVIERNAHQLLHLISEVLDISGGNESFYRLRPARIHVKRIVEDVVANLKSLAEKKGLSLDVHFVGPDVESTCDPYRIRQVVYNMVGNAIKFTENGSVTVTCGVDDRADDEFYHHYVLVKDTGIGVSENHTDRIFEPFMQADESITRQYSGTGLGLAISRRIARLLGGNVVLKSSEPGKGSEFLFTFVGERDLKEHAVRDSQPDNVGSIAGMKTMQLHNLSIVVIDDNKDNLLLIERILASHGARVRMALDGESGISMSLDEVPDIILLDIQMPGIDGYTTARRLRSQGFQKPIIAVTAKVVAGEKERCLEAGFTELLAKPFDSETLLRKITEEHRDYA